MSCEPCARFAEALSARREASWSRSWYDVRTARKKCALCCLVHDTYEADAAHTEVIRVMSLREPQRSCTIEAGRLPVDNEMILVKSLSPLDTYVVDHVTEEFAATTQQCALWLSIGPSDRSPPRSTSDQLKHLMLQPVTEVGNASTAFFEGRLLSSSSIDIGVLTQWLRRCNDHHPDCRHTSEEIEIPGLILIDVNSRIAKPATGKSTPYTALSYCCGEGDLGLVGIDGTLPTPIPRTIEDAISVTQRLGFQYIWVDCYCIPQDNEVLRRVALENMWKIYRGSSLTIIAPYGTADTGLPGIRPGLRPVNDFVGNFNGKMWMPVPVDDAYEQAWNHWRMRAWTYQEGLLSRRSLFFGLTKMYFTCRTEGFVESLAEPWILDPAGSGKIINPIRYSHGLVEYDFPPLDRAIHFSFHKYRTLLLEYTRRNITYLSDRLDAVLGVMNALSTGGSVTFHFGLLESDFIRSLLWTSFRTRGRSYARHTENCQFPSWSWAGSEGPSQVLSTDWRFIGTHISKIARTEEVVCICHSTGSGYQGRTLGLANSVPMGSRSDQNGSLWLYKPLIVVKASMTDALLDLTAAASLYDHFGRAIPRMRFSSWPRMAAVPVRVRSFILLLAIAIAGEEVAVLLLAKRGAAADGYVALGWATITSEIWTQLGGRQEEVKIY